MIEKLWDEVKASFWEYKSIPFIFLLFLSMIIYFGMNFNDKLEAVLFKNISIVLIAVLLLLFFMLLYRLRDSQ